MPALLRRLLFTAGVFPLLILLAAPAVADPDLSRVSGSDRISTAVHASQRGWDGAATAIVATASRFPDALAAVPLAAERDAPLLLTTPDTLPEAVGAELERLGATDVVVLGGPVAVSDRVVAEILALDTSPEVTRLAGEHRYETAAAVAEEVGASMGEALVVLGTDFPDAVSAGSLAGGPGTPPILLTESDGLPAATAAALDRLGVRQATIIGGPTAVGEAVVRDLESMGVSVHRLAGENRYETSTRVAVEALARHSEGRRPALVATGTDHPDALAAGALAARVDGILVLANPRQPHAPLDEFLRERSSTWTDSLAVGGQAALSEDALEAIARSLRGEEHPEPEQKASAADEQSPPAIALAEARRQIGKPYRYGGNGPSSFDCSGLTRWAWREAGVDLPRSSRDQYASLPKVAPRDRQPGDLIAYGNPVHHIAIYAGDGMMVEAPSSGGRVREVTVRTSGLRGYARPDY